MCVAIHGIFYWYIYNGGVDGEINKLDEIDLRLCNFFTFLPVALIRGLLPKFMSTKYVYCFSLDLSNFQKQKICASLNLMI